MRNVAIVGAGMTPFAEHFELGIKDLMPMAYAEAVANVDKGIHEVGDRGRVVRRAVDHRRVPVRHSGRHPRPDRDSGDARRKCLRHRQ